MRPTTSQTKKYEMKRKKKEKKNCLPTSPKSFLPSHEVGEANLFSHPLVGHAITVYFLFFKAMGRWNIFFFFFVLILIRVLYYYYYLLLLSLSHFVAIVVGDRTERAQGI